jgi:hypothetical protein
MGVFLDLILLASSAAIFARLEPISPGLAGKPYKYRFFLK